MIHRADRSALAALFVVCALVTAHAPSALMPAATAAPAPCTIVEGVSIGAVRLGMSAMAVLAIAGTPAAQQVQAPQSVLTLRAPWYQASVSHGVVVRVSTRSPECRTRTAIGPGALLAAVRRVYAGAVASAVTPSTDGELLSYPFSGIAFASRGDRVVAVEVFAAEALGIPPPPHPSPVRPAAVPSPTPEAPTPVPSPVPLWSLRDLGASVEDSILVVTGVIETRGPPVRVYAEVNALSSRGARIASSDGVPHPNPVAAGRPGTFEVRLRIDDVVQRLVVSVRPVGTITGALAEQVVEIRDLQRFAPVASRRLQVGVQFLADPARLIVEIRSGLSVAVAGATAVVDYQTRCFVRFPPPGRFILDSRSASVAIPSIPPGGSARAVVPLTAPTDACHEFIVVSSSARIASVRLVD